MEKEEVEKVGRAMLDSHFRHHPQSMDHNPPKQDIYIAGDTMAVLPLCFLRYRILTHSAGGLVSRSSSWQIAVPSIRYIEACFARRRAVRRSWAVGIGFVLTALYQ